MRFLLCVGLLVGGALSAFVELVEDLGSGSREFMMRNDQMNRLLNVPELLHPHYAEGGQNLKEFSHQVKWHHPDDPSKRVILEYEAKLHPDMNIISVDLNKQILGMSCDGTGLMHLKLDHTMQDIQDFINSVDANTVITSSPNWKCWHDDLPAGASIRQVTGVVRSLADPHHITLSTVPIHFSKLFEHLDMSFRTSAFPEAHVIDENSNADVHEAFKSAYTQLSSEVVGPKDTAADSLHKMGSMNVLCCSRIRHFFQKAWSAVKSVAKVVANTVVTVAKVIAFAFTGNLDLSKSFTLASLSWNYNSGTHGANTPDVAITPHITCHECFVHSQVDLYGGLKISGYHLSSTEIYIEGSLEHYMDIVVTLLQGTAVDEFDFVLGTIHVPQIDFAIGPIPFTINITIPIHLGAEIDFADSSALSFVTAVNANVKYGMQYSPSAGFQYINSHSFSPSASVSPVNKASIGVTVYVMPVFVIIFEHIGGPTVGFKGFVEESLDYDSSNTACYSGKGLTSVLDWGLQLAIGAEIDITFAKVSIYSKTYGPDIVYSGKWPILDKCFAVTAMESDVADIVPLSAAITNPLHIGVVFRGEVTFKATASCAQYHSLHVVLQYFGPDASGRHIYIGNPNHNFARNSSMTSMYNVMCLGQQYYAVSNGVIAATPTQSGDLNVTFTGCSLNAQGYLYAALHGSASLSSNNLHMSIESSDTCVQSPIVLNRVPPQ